MPSGGKRPGSGRPRGKRTEAQKIYLTPEHKDWLQDKGKVSETIGDLIQDAIEKEAAEKEDLKKGVENQNCL